VTPEATTRALQTLRAVPWLASLGEEALAEVIESGDLVTFPAGAALMRELELGDELFIIIAGELSATIAAGRDATVPVARLASGDTCGELSMFTRELRSATVTAISPVEALRIHRLELEALVERHPRIAAHFAREIGARLRDSDEVLDQLLTASNPATATARLSGRMAAVTPSRGSLARAWRELVLSRRQELPFLALAAFLATLLVIRAAVFAFEHLGVGLFALLRTAYTTGIALVMVSVSFSLMRFSPRVRRAIAVAYGIGFALIFNELSVFLAFDTFYLDMTTRDPDMIFDVEQLYRRSESSWAVALVLAVLVQATFLGRFYRRGAFILTTRLRALVSRRR
jgi:CRP-like cAMP-binding protein